MSNPNVHESKVLSPLEFGSLEQYCSDKSITYLKNSLKSLEQGRDPTPPFPLYGKRDSSVVDDFYARLEKMGLPEWLIKYEETRLAKVGLQGGVPKWDDLKEIFLLYKTAPKDVKFVDDEIMHEMFREYSKLNCNMKSAADALDHLKRTDKIETRAAGWSEFQLKKTDPEAQKLALRLCQKGLWIHGVGYTFARYQKLKLRIFMPMPFSSMIKQAQYFVPFLGNIQMDIMQAKARSPFVAWSDKIGFKNCFDILEQQINDAKVQENETLVYFSNDFEKMDTRTASSQYESFFIPILESALHMHGNKELREAMLFTTTAPIYSPGGIMKGNHGTASGAEVTNGGESVCNDYFQRRYLKLLLARLKGKARIIARRFNGDDSALVFAITCTLDEFKEASEDILKQVCEETGFDIQFDKLDYSTEFGRYCQNVYYYDRKDHTLHWMYPTILVMNAIVHPEHEYTKAQWDKDYRDLDIVQKLDNAVNHPAYTELVDYVMAGLKYPLLGQSEQETRRILSKYESYRNLQSLGERYNRTDYNISTSPTVKYVLSRR